MENGIQYLETERYTPTQINNPSLNLKFEPVNPSASISGYRRFYRPETTQQETSVQEQETPVQETMQAETVSTPPVQQTASAETKPKTSSTKKGKRYNNQQDFIKDMTEAYTKALASRGISTDYAKMLVAQDALESNWGKSSLVEDFNFGGIKAKDGIPFVERETSEYDSKKGMHKTKAKFRKFNSLEDYANYKIDLLNGKRYQAFIGDPSQFYNRVAAGGYATDPNYVSKLMGIYNSPIFSAKQGGSMPSRIDMLVTKFNKQFNK